ncbi:MAG: hypothetical protein AAGI24_04585 [Pseudomonadota bacterium]
MLARSLVGVFLSIPASAAIMGVFLSLTASERGIIVPSLLMFFPLWVALASASYLQPTARRAAAVLLGISGGGFGLLAVIKFLGASAV